MISLYLTPGTWDLAVDVNGNIAMADEPYRIAQDVSSACKLWLGEAYYNTGLGVDWDRLLGEKASLQVIRNELEREAKRIVGVTTATAVIDFDSSTRKVTGFIGIRTTDGDNIRLPL